LLFLGKERIPKHGGILSIYTKNGHFEADSLKLVTETAKAKKDANFFNFGLVWVDRG
jgi:hypothetical protein